MVINREPTASVAKPEIERLFRGAYVKAWMGEAYSPPKMGFKFSSCTNDMAKDIEAIMFKHLLERL